MNKHVFNYPTEKAGLNTFINGHVKVQLEISKDKNFIITIEEKKPSKTWQQCKGWHRILGVIAAELNNYNVDNKFWSVEHVKYVIKHVIQFGEIRLETFMPRSFATATKEEAMEIISKTQEYAVEELSMELQDVELCSEELIAFNKYYSKHV